METWYEISVAAHPDDTVEITCPYEAYDYAARLVEFGHSPDIIRHGSSGHAKCVSWTEMHENYGS